MNFNIQRLKPTNFIMQSCGKKSLLKKGGVVKAVRTFAKKEAPKSLKKRNGMEVLEFFKITKNQF